MLEIWILCICLQPEQKLHQKQQHMCVVFHSLLCAAKFSHGQSFITKPKKNFTKGCIVHAYLSMQYKEKLVTVIRLQLPSHVCHPTTLKDSRRTPAKASLSGFLEPL
jgi:hypothetical protein